MTGNELRDRFQALDAFVTDHAAVWRSRAFFGVPVAWEADFPDVARWLRGLPDDAVDALHADPTGLAGGPAALGSWVATAATLTTLPRLPPGDARHPEVARGVGARKWEQVAALAAAAPTRGVTRWVDWCAGKGHLGRTLGHGTGLPVLTVERRPELCEDAVALGARLGVDVRAEVRDVLADPPRLGPGDGLVALHACGVLTDRALDAARDATALAVAPCCPHFRPGDRLDIRSRLDVDPSELRFATAEEVVAPPRLRVRRRTQEAYRLALDALIREATGTTTHTRLRPVPSPWMDLSFPAFVARMADRDGLSLPAAWDPARALAAGEAHAALVARLGLVRALFRRPVELWVVFDRALRLRGWDVAVDRFVDRRATPRDVVIRATRR